MAGEVGLDGGGDEFKDIAALLTAGFDCGQHRFDEATAAVLQMDAAVVAAEANVQVESARLKQANAVSSQPLAAAD